MRELRPRSRRPSPHSFPHAQGRRPRPEPGAGGRRRYDLRALALLAAAAGSAGCASDTLPRQSLLDGLRVLALPATQPEVGPGETTSVTALVADTPSGGRVLSWSAEQCFDPGTSLGGEPTCDGAADRQSLGSGTLDLTATTPPGLGEGAGVTFTAPAASAFAAYPAADLHNGVTFLVIYRFTAPTGEATTAFRRIGVTSRAPAERNQNPGAFTVTVDGAAATALPTVVARLKATLGSPADAETYTLRSRSGPDTQLVEQLTFSWLVTGGEVQFYRTQSGSENEFTPAAIAPTPAALVVILRDNRGGVRYAKLP